MVEFPLKFSMKEQTTACNIWFKLYFESHMISQCDQSLTNCISLRYIIHHYPVPELSTK